MPPTGIQDIKGALCPMGCGETLHLMTSGMICCLAPKCPDKGAAQKILRDPETEHVVTFQQDGSFAVMHPLRDRLGDLLSCPVQLAVLALDAPPQEGRFRARINVFGLELEDIGAGS